MITSLTLAAALLIATGVSASAQTPPSKPLPRNAEPGSIELVALPVPATPLVSVRLMFRAGAVHDPKGKEGLSALTALMVGSGGTARRTYLEVIDALYPMAAAIDVITDREVTVFATQVHRDVLGDLTPLLLEAVLEPGFKEEDFTRNREQLLAYLTTTLRSANDELLGLEMIQQTIFAGHPYGHAPAGTVEGLKSITLGDLREFYREHYTRANLILGVAGSYPEGYPTRLVQSLQRLPAGGPARLPLPAAPVVRGRHFTIVDKLAESTGIHFGYPLPVTRRDDAFYALMVANSFLGEHRTFHGRLMQELRGKRGLNYGNYSYIEHWDNPPGTSNPPPNRPRRQQYFSIWVRPVLPANSVFALRAAIAEVNRFIERGLTHEGFEQTREFLTSYSKLWARSLSDRLGFHMDSRFYDMPYFIDHIEDELKDLTLEQVNAAIKRYIQTAHFHSVLIADDARALSETLRADRPSPITYPNPVAEDVRLADKATATLPLAPASVEILPISQTFVSRK